MKVKEGVRKRRRENRHKIDAWAEITLFIEEYFLLNNIRGLYIHMNVSVSECV